MRTLGAAAVLIGTLECLAAAATGANVNAAGAMVERFLGHKDAEPLVQYRAVRTMRARNERFNKEARMQVLTTMDRSAGFQYRVLMQEGSGVVRRRALEPILKAEAATIGDGTAAQAALTGMNYDFTVEPSSESGWIRLQPRRRDSMLVDGAIFVRPDGDLVRIEGRLAKSPSFWTSRVEIVRDYQRIAGVRVPVRTESRAWVKLAGMSTLEITYAYEEINGFPVVVGESR